MKLLVSAVFLIASVLASSGLAIPADEQQTDAQAQLLLQKHRSYVGWQFGDGTFQSMRIAGSVTDKKGDKLQTVAFSSVGLAFQETHTLLKQSSITFHKGFTGSVFWQCYTSGFTTPVYGESAKAMASYFMLMEEGTSGLPGSFHGDKNVDGKDVAVVRVTMKFGDPIDLYIDPASGAYVKAVVNPDGPFEATYHIASYADVGSGKKMVGSYRIGESGDVHANTKWEPNAAITSEELHPPAPTATWSFNSGQPVAIHLTNNRILVDATVNGVKGTFILDTGSDAIRLDDRFADSAKTAALEGSSDVMSVYGTNKERVRRVAEMNFGNASLKNVLVYSEDFERNGYRGLDAKGYAGLIGADFFAGAIVKLNVYDSTMSILDPATDLSGLKALPVLVDLSAGELTVPMTLDKTIDVNALLDTGNPTRILFAYDLVKKHFPFNPHLLTLGPIQYDVGDWSACCMGANYALLGFDFLKHFDYVFDYPHGRLYLTPNKN